MENKSNSAGPSAPLQYSHNQVYSIDLLSSDLRQEEMILRACDSLEKLEQVALDIFSKLTDNISEKNKNLASICKRIDIAQAKINKVKGSKKATVVFSSPKYPNLHSENLMEDLVPPNRKPLFINDLNIPSHNSYNITERFTSYDSEHLLEKKRQFFSIPYLSNSDSSDLSRSITKEEHEKGLGRPPDDLNSVASLLLFNTSDNPYNKAVTTDPLLTQKSKKGLDSVDRDQSCLPDAPHSIQLGLELYGKAHVETFSYNPSLGEVPAISVPDFLPDLAGIANDLHYSADLGPSIAPSLTEGLQQLELPPVQNWSFSAPPPLPALPKEVASIAPPPVPQICPPPIPPPPLPLTILPPPHPPPPSIAATVEKETPSSRQGTVPASDSRTSLMEAIRGAGGAGRAKLKSAKERRLMETKRNKELGPDAPSGKDSSSTGGPVDLMSDLAAKLQLRRKGLMGSQQKEKSKGTLDVLMERVPVIPQRAVADVDEEDWK